VQVSQQFLCVEVPSQTLFAWQWDRTFMFECTTPSLSVADGMDGMKR